MQISRQSATALLIAIVVAGLHFWFFPAFILSMGIEPTGTPLGEVYKTGTLTGLPGNMPQVIIKYQYLIALLLAFSAFGAVYFGLTLEADGKEFTAVTCAVPVVSNFLLSFLLSIFLPILTMLALSFWFIALYRKSNRKRLFPCLYSLAVNLMAAIVLPLYIKDIFVLIT